jgi:hypothetical protein
MPGIATRPDDGKHIEVRGDAAISIPDHSRAVIAIKPGEKTDSMKVVLTVGKGCVVDVIALLDRPLSLEQTSRVGRDSVIRTCGLWLAGGDGRFVSSLEGEGAEMHDVQIFVGRGTDRLRLDSELRHSTASTKGDITIKGVVKDRASADLAGLIKIEKDGAGAESFLSEHVLLLSPHAHASANPELEISNNDVSSRHSASVSRPDWRKIFYLMSRGLAMEDARNLIVEGFLGSAVEKIGKEGMREEIAERMLGAL